jgi:hypothetical protein
MGNVMITASCAEGPAVVPGVEPARPERAEEYLKQPGHQLSLVRQRLVLGVVDRLLLVGRRVVLLRLRRLLIRPVTLMRVRGLGVHPGVWRSLRW